MEDMKVLQFLDRFKSLFEKIGIDYNIMRKILQVKLIMDGRRVPTAFSNRQKQDDGKKNQFISSLIVYFFMGLIMIPFILMKSNYIYQMSIIFGMIIFFVMSSLISEFSSVLLDVKDKNIIGTRPVDPKTLRMAKTIHVSIYMVTITAALTGPALVLSIIKQGILFFILFLTLIILADLFSIVLTALVYALILRFFDGEKLKDIINYVQIILSMVIMIGYQLVGRLFNIIDLNVTFTPKWWQYFIIPVWFSAPFQILKKSEVNITLIIFTILAIAMPIITLLVYIKKMPEFEQNLNKLTNNYQNRKNIKKQKQSVIPNLLCRNKEEIVFFRFTLDMIKQERDFKLRVYPNMGFTIIIPFIFIFQQLSYRSIQEIADGKSYFAIYLCGLLVPTVITMIQYSERYKAAWIYKVLPIQNVESVIKGSVKAILYKLCMPLFLVEAMIFGFIYGARIIPDLVLVFENIMIYAALCFMIDKKHFPFSRIYNASQSGNIGVVLVMMMVFGLLGGIHFAFRFLSFGVYINIVLSFLVCIFIWKIAFRSSLEKLVAE